MQAAGEFTVTAWNESDVDGALPSAPMKRVSAIFEPSGMIQGRFFVEYLMHYSRYDEAAPHDASADYAGYLTFQGGMGGKTGTFVLRDTGVYANGAAL